jgi:DNA-binding XRE family transcriptional regulator
MTRLESFLRTNRIRPSHLAREAGCARQHLGRLRKGKMIPRINLAVRLAIACGRLAGRRVALNDLFEVGDDE